MSDLVTAAKTLRALGDDDDGLKCVESDPAEIQRSALKKIRRAAGPAVAAFTMGILKYPRRAQGALMDALYAARSTLYAAHSHFTCKKYVSNERRYVKSITQRYIRTQIRQEILGVVGCKCFDERGFSFSIFRISEFII